VINIDSEYNDDYPRGELSDSSPTDFKPTYSIKKTASMTSKGRVAYPEKYLSDETPRGNREEFEGGVNESSQHKLFYYNVDKNVLGIKFFESEID